MTIFLMILHVFVCILLAIIILVQSGRGGGLTESFSGAESMFGAQTNEFLIKATTVAASLFLITCLSLAVLSSKKDVSLMSKKAAEQAVNDVGTTIGKAADKIGQEVEENLTDVPKAPPSKPESKAIEKKLDTTLGTGNPSSSAQ